MSTIGITYHDEDIHRIIKKPATPPVKSPRYKSRRKSLGLKSLTKNNGHQTFGLAHYDAPEAKNFLKKKQKSVVVPKFIDKKEFRCSTVSKSSVPKPSYQKKTPIKKNFVKENIKKIETLQPKEPVPRRVETPRGTTKDLVHLLQMIKIRESEKYGRIPKYLCERKVKERKEKEELKRQQEALLEYRQKMGIGTRGMGENVFMVDAETRQKILNGLKENWNELSKQFLKLPVMTDTWPKIKRKMFLEKEIDQLEKDINLVESHPYIYLEKTERPCYERVMEFEQEQSKEAFKEGPELKKEQEKAEKKDEKVSAQVEQKFEPSSDEVIDDKKEDDTEINIYNY